MGLIIHFKWVPTSETSVNRTPETVLTIDGDAPPPAAVPGSPDEPDALDAWQALPRTMVTTSENPFVQFLLEAIRTGSAVELAYHGGSTPGARRCIRPQCLFRVKGHGEVYLAALCETRGEARTFCLDRISTEHVRAIKSFYGNEFNGE